MITTPPTRPNVEGHGHRMDHKTHRRRTLPPDLAEALAIAHADTGLSYRQVGDQLDLDWSYWRRLTRGERCPSRQVAGRIVDLLDLGDDVAAELLAESVVREPSSPGRRGRVVRSGS